MTPQESIKAGDLEAALSSAKAAVRESPDKSAPRIFLFQIECVLGHWDKARTQLEVLASLDPETSLFAQIFAPVLDCEIFRAEVFAGRRTPIIFGEPEEWMGSLVRAIQLDAEGQADAAAALRLSALDAAQPIPGQINEKPFAWIADADPRLGPILEVIMDGCYRWVPFSRISAIHFDPPKDLRDLVWFPARLTWTNGGGASAFIPARYPGSESAADPAIRLARRTEWAPKSCELFEGIGQRLLATDEEEFSLLDVRDIALAAAPDIATPPAADA